MDFLLLIFYLSRYFKILRKSENGSKTKMDFSNTKGTHLSDHPIVSTTLLNRPLPVITHTPTPPKPFQLNPASLPRQVYHYQQVSAQFFPVLDLFFVPAIRFCRNLSR